MAQSTEFRIILDKINYSGTSVGSEWIFDFDFKISNGSQSFDLKQSISRKVSFNKNQQDINRTLVRADFDPVTKAVSISGKVKASEEGSNEKYSESGAGSIQSLTVNYAGMNISQTLLAPGIKVKEYKGPKYDDSKLATAILDFEFKVVIIGISDNPCDAQAIKEAEVSSFRNLTNGDIEASQTVGDLAGATQPGRFALACCIALNEKNEYRAKVTMGDAIIRWGIHTSRYKDPIVGGPNANITDCKTADEAIKTMEKALTNGGVVTLTPSSPPWFPEIGLIAHELTHVEDHEKLYKGELVKVKKKLEGLKINLPQGASDAQIKSMQDTLSMQYTDEWLQACIKQIVSPPFSTNTETNAQHATDPILKRAIQKVKDWKKANNCK